MRLMVLTSLLLLGACEVRRTDETTNRPADIEAPVASVAPAAPVPPPPLDAPTAPDAPAPSAAATPEAGKSVEAAAKLLDDYFAAVATKQYGRAYRMWSGAGEATGMGEAEFAESFAKYKAYEGRAGEPGDSEGAMGSIYVEIPARVTGVLARGGVLVLEGPMTLRRVNDVPGATPEQLQWRIYRSGLTPRPRQASHRFIGRWATEQANCAARAWRFTADRLTTAAGSVCTFRHVSEIPGGYDIAARCTSKGPPVNDTLELRFAESARALLVESDVLGDSGLVRCR